MSTLFHINRQTPSALGTGLPFMLHTRNQQRFDEVTTPETGAEWCTPQNRLPCLQVWCDFPLTKIQLVPVNGTSDSTPFEIPLDNFEHRCTAGDFPTNIYYTTEVNLGFSLPCGQYYFKLEFSAGVKPYYYSEVFTVGGVCAFGFDLAWVVTGVNMDNSANITFTIVHADSMQPTGYSSAVGVTVYTTKTFSDTIPTGNTLVSVSASHTYCGTYEQSFTFSNLLGVVTVAKNY